MRSFSWGTEEVTPAQSILWLSGGAEGLMTSWSKEIVWHLGRWQAA